MEDKLKYWVWLNTIPGIGSRKGNQLLDCFKDPERIWNATGEELKKLPFLNEANVRELLETAHRTKLNEVVEKINRNQIGIVTIQDEDYPYYLKNTYDPPVLLYVRGKFVQDEKIIAVVGSRNASSYGLNMAERISGELVNSGITVISGMARGIDTYAHYGALRAKGRTLAVLGCGPDIAYPSQNKSLMEEIIKTGAIISEYAPGVPPVPLNFPARNRIISGISLGVVVVEANEKSGSLITANFALDQGREVFAIPGNINSINSKGTNKLIKDGAKLITNVDDILEELRITVTGEKRLYSEIKESKKYPPAFVGLDPEEQKLAGLLVEEPCHIDRIANQCGISVQQASSLLIMLELKGVVEQLPGKVFKLRE